jgi:hypothetical protein
MLPWQWDLNYPGQRAGADQEKEIIAKKQVKKK